MKMINANAQVKLRSIIQGIRFGRVRQIGTGKSRYVFLFFVALLALGVFFSGCSPQGEFKGGGINTHSTGAPPLLDRDLFFGDPQYAGAQLSPDGRNITFRKQYGGVMNVWIKGLEEDFEAARPLTAEGKRPVSRYFWSHDSRYILYVQDTDGDENDHIFRVDVNEEPGPASNVPIPKNLTPFDGARTQIYSVPRLFPDRLIVGINDRNSAFHDVYHLDIASGERRLLIENTDNIARWFTDLTGNVRAGIRQTADGGQEMLMIRETGFERVYSTGSEEWFNPLRYQKDGVHITMVSNAGDRDKAELLRFNPETGESVLIERDPEGEVDFGWVIFSEITQEILAVVYVGDKPRMVFRNDTFRRKIENLQELFRGMEVSVISRSHDENKWLFRVQSDVDPGSVYFYDCATGESEFLYRTRPELPSAYLAEMIPVRYTARDGLEIPAYLTIPKGVAATDLPVVVIPHGGPWARDYWGYHSYAQFFANRGYAVLQINFRGSTGYGKSFLNAGNREWGTGAMQHDITDGVHYLVSEGVANPDRIAIFGRSYGGYAALAGLAFTPDLYAAGVSFVGPSNIITLLNAMPAYWGPMRKILHIRVGDPDDPEDYVRLKAQSPLFAAENIKAPLMVVQGANDPRVVKAESDQIVAALRELGRDVEYLVAEDEGHAFVRQENRLAFAYAIEKFFAGHLGGRYQQTLQDEYRNRLEAITVDIDTVEPPAKPL